MIELTAEQIAVAADAVVLAGEPDSTGDDLATRAVVDSRELQPGDLFFALPGERTHGAEFADAALRAGAWGVVVEREHAHGLAASAGGRVFATDNPLGALHGVASAWLERLRGAGARVVGVTGSTGKTSTKDILLALLSEAFDGRAHANRQNFNTEVGLPLTVLEAPLGTQVLVLEMAMRGMGQIRELARIAQPEVGVITNIGPVHLELVGTIEDVAEAKAELIAELSSHAACVVPAAEEALHPHLRSDVRVLTFAGWQQANDDPLSRVAHTADASADIRALSRELHNGHTVAEIEAGGERARFEFNFSHAHNLSNALAAIGAAHALGLSLEQLSEGAGKISFSDMRGQLVELPEDLLIINDCYNANPISMRAALDHLAQVAGTRAGGRSVAVLGDMKELGSAASGYHREVGEHAARRGVALLVAIGEHRSALVDGFGAAGEVRQAVDAIEAADLVDTLVEPGDTLLVKASRGVGLERITTTLEEKRTA